jgi:rhamnogalacturonyl hydrolase YesR
MTATIPWDSLAAGRLLGTPAPPDPVCARVTRALLTMQRASWEQGVAAQAFLEGGDAELAVLLAREAALRQDAGGRLAVLYHDVGVTDPAAAGEPVVFAALATGEAALRAAAERMLAWLAERAPRSPQGVLYHQLPAPDGELWSDSFDMAPPFLALAGRPEDAVRQLRGLWSALWSPERRLLAHRGNVTQGRFTRAAGWGVGNGWAAVGLLRTLRHLPAGWRAEREELGGYLRDVVAGCLAHQGAEGLFHDVLDEPASFVEVNLAQMLAWTIYRGVPGGELEPALLATAERMRAAARARVDADGFVQGVCGAPGFDRPGVAAEGQAFFLRMEAARAACRGRAP